MQDELIDAPDVSPQVLVENLKELDLLNRYTGGHAISTEGVRQLLKNKNRVYHIMDLGCGSGDWLLFIAKWARRKGYRLKLTGIDKSEHAIRFLNKKCKNHPEISGVVGDYRGILKSESADIYHSALFCHHLSNVELIELFNHIGCVAKEGFVVNDLQRTAIAYYAAKFSTNILRGSNLSKHDGPVSVLRGFKKREIAGLLQKAGITKYNIYYRRFFRFLVVGLPIGNDQHFKI